MKNKILLAVLERFFWWTDDILFLIYDALKVISFTMIEDIPFFYPRVVNWIYDYFNWHNQLIFFKEHEND